jgi:hypothetical protein
MLSFKFFWVCILISFCTDLTKLLWARPSLRLAMYIWNHFCMHMQDFDQKKACIFYESISLPNYIPIIGQTSTCEYLQRSLYTVCVRFFIIAIIKEVQHWEKFPTNVNPLWLKCWIPSLRNSSSTSSSHRWWAVPHSYLHCWSPDNH